MKLELSSEGAEALAEGLVMLEEQLQHAKDHLLECPSVESPEMLLDVASDYDWKLSAYRAIRKQIEEQQ